MNEHARRRSSTALAAALAVAGLAAAMVVLPDRAEGRSSDAPVARSSVEAPAQATPRGRSSSCDAVVSQAVTTPTLRLCEQTEIRAHVEPVCKQCPAGLNVILVLMRENHQPRWQRDEARGIVTELTRWQDRPEFEDPVRIGVVRYDSQLRGGAMLRLTDRLQSAYGPIASAGVDYDMCPVPPFCLCWPYQGFLRPAAAAARGMLRDVHEAEELGDDDRKCDFVVVFNESTLGVCPATGDRMDMNLYRQVSEARDLERDVGTMMVGCPSTEDSDCQGPREMPRNRSYYAQAMQLGGLPQILRREIERLASPHLVRRLTLTERLPAGLTLTWANEPPTSVVTDETGTNIVWEWQRLEAEKPHDVRFRVSPSAVGAFTVTGALDITDSENRGRQLPMPTSQITVTGPCIVPSPTPTDTPTATSTLTPSVTPTPTATATSTSTATPTPAARYLPVVVRERCVKQHRSLDVSLVIDASTSMLEPTAPGRTKLEAAVSAARSFLGLLDLGGTDRAAIVTFNSAATVLQALTPDRGALNAALDAIQVAPQTCLPCAVETGEAALGPPSGAARTRTIVLLTDGRSNPRPAEEAVAIADGVAARGVLLFTIGIGSELDVDALRAIASRDEYFFHTADASDLERIYAEIDRLIPCPGPFWPGR